MRAIAPNTPDAPQLPPGFQATIVADDLYLPLDMEFMATGDILVAEKGVGEDIDGISRIRLVKNGQTQPTPVLELSTNVYWDSGILGIILDPDFGTNHHFYVWYATGEQALNWSGESIMRLSRFTYNPETETADPAGEQIILEDSPWGKLHHGNSLQFDDNGNLIMGLGNRGDLATSQDMGVLAGKMIRIRPTATGYEIPTDNPFVGDNNVRPEIYALGLRNPYRMAVRDDGTVAIGDVGRATWEEINLLQAAANYGFPEREGPCPIDQGPPCDPAPPQYTDPVIAYLHDESLGTGSSGAVTGVAFYEGDDFPAQYHDRLFFSDINQGFIAAADVATGEFELFAENLYGLVDLKYWNGSVYALDIGGGKITQIYYTGSDNRPPDPVLDVSEIRGAPPLTVTFSAEGTTDPDDVALTYHWDFGDGVRLSTAEPTVSHTYTEDGTYEASLQVTDIRGGESAVLERTITVYSGEFPEIEFTNLTEPGRALFHGGDDIRYTAARSTLDGLADPPFSWRVDLHHNQHAHPIIANTEAISGVLPISTDNHEGDWNIWFRFYLTMHTDQGQEIIVQDELRPEFVNLTLTTAPADVPVVINHGRQETPYTLKSIIGVDHTLEAPEAIIHERGIGRFDFWVWHQAWPTVEGTTAVPSDSISHERALTITAPADDYHYVAQYAYDRPADLVWLQFVAESD